MTDWIHVATVLGLAGLAVLAHYLGAHDLSIALGGGALGYATQRRGGTS